MENQGNDLALYWQSKRTRYVQFSYSLGCDFADFDHDEEFRFICFQIGDLNPKTVTPTG